MSETLSGHLLQHPSVHYIPCTALSRIRSDWRSFSGKNKERTHWFGQNSGPFGGILTTAHCCCERRRFLWSRQRGDGPSLTERDTCMHKQMRHPSWSGLITVKHARKINCYKWIQRIQMMWYISAITNINENSPRRPQARPLVIPHTGLTPYVGSCPTNIRINNSWKFH